MEAASRRSPGELATAFSKKQGVVMLALCVSLLGGGCSTGLSEEEFVQVADPICGEVAAQVGASEFLDWGPTLQKAADSFGELDAPEGDASELVESYRALAAAHTELVAAIDKALGDDNLDQVAVFFTEDGKVWSYPREQGWMFAHSLDVSQDLYPPVKDAMASASAAAQRLSLDACALSLGEEESEGSGTSGP